MRLVVSLIVLKLYFVRFNSIFGYKCIWQQQNLPNVLQHKVLCAEIDIFEAVKFANIHKYIQIYIHRSTYDFSSAPHACNSYKHNQVFVCVVHQLGIGGCHTPHSPLALALAPAVSLHACIFNKTQNCIDMFAHFMSASGYLRCAILIVATLFAMLLLQHDLDFICISLSCKQGCKRN